MIFISRLIFLLLLKIKQRSLFDALFSFLKKTFARKFLVSFFRLAFFVSLFLFIILTIEVLAFGMGTYYYLRSTLPDPSPSAMASRPLSTRIYDRHGEFLYEVHGDVKRRFVSLDKIPVYLQEATIAIEDKNFYKHHGYDLVAIARAFIINLKNKGISQGASTITQQLARTLFLNQDKAYIRKIKELILAMEIEKRYTKDQILEMYLNNIPYGSIAYGISAASEIYLNKPVENINFIESVNLAALPKAPSDYSPFGSNKRALDKRAQMVIDAMHESGIISDAEFNYIKNQSKPLFVQAPTHINAPHFVFYVLEELEKKYGSEKVHEGGLDIYTSLDLSLQREAEKIITQKGKENEKKYGAENASLVAVDPKTGEILVMVGSRDYYETKNGAVNVAISLRQPGSSFKPYVYATAIANGLSPDDYIRDNRFNFAKYNYGVDYIPRNYDGKYHGMVTVRQALAGSLNIPAVKVLVNAGIDKTIDLAENMGISTLGDRNRFGPSLALGGGEVKLLEHTAAFGVFGNEGRKAPLVSILKINNQEGNTVFEKKNEEAKIVLDNVVAYKINNILSDAKAREYIFGLHSRLEVPGYEVAAKTGTTQDARDAWTIGYTPSLAVGVWSGNNDNHPMHNNANGYVVATPIWQAFMKIALPKFDKKDFVVPSDFDTKDILVAELSQPQVHPSKADQQSWKNKETHKIDVAPEIKINKDNFSLSVFTKIPLEIDLLSIEQNYFSLE